MKFLIYLVGLRRSSGLKSGQFMWSDQHQKFIYQGRELELEEFNQLMSGQWPLQKMANLQVSGFAFVDKPSKSKEKPAPEQQEQKNEEPKEQEQEAPESPSNSAEDEEEPIIPRRTRKSKN
jgi:hypothetical protein